MCATCILETLVKLLSIKVTNQRVNVEGLFVILIKTNVIKEKIFSKHIMVVVDYTIKCNQHAGLKTFYLFAPFVLEA